MITYLSSTMVQIEKDCPFCGQTCEGSVPFEGYRRWRWEGELIQTAMPTVPATTREWLISGICPDCQSSIFGEED